MARKFPEELLKLISLLKKWPGVGTRTAERFAFDLLSWESADLHALGENLLHLKERVLPCPTCGCLTDQGKCTFCTNRDNSQLCLLASSRDAYAIEETGQYRGLYHVINHLLSPLDGRHANTLRIDLIENRIETNQVREIIIAFDSTLEGDATALYLKKLLARPHLSISRIAFGLPVGSSLEHIDGGTLARSFNGRQTI